MDSSAKFAIMHGWDMHRNSVRYAAEIQHADRNLVQQSYITLH